MEIKTKSEQKIEIPRQIQEAGGFREGMKILRNKIDKFQSSVEFDEFAVDEYRKALGEVLKTNPSAKEAGEILQGQLKMLSRFSPEERKEFWELISSLPVERQGQGNTFREILGGLAKIVNSEKEKEQREQAEIAKTHEVIAKRYEEKRPQETVRQTSLRDEEVKPKQEVGQTRGFFARLKSIIGK